MSFLDTLIGRLAPHECLGCGFEGGLVCKSCENKLAPPVSRCYRCQRSTQNFLTCQECRALSPLKQVTPVAKYNDLAKQLVLSLKFSGAQAAGQTLAKYLVAQAQLQGCFYIVPVPTATSRARQRGYDQAKILARQLSRQSGVPYLDCLVRRGQTHQVGASRQRRLEQLNGAFRVRRTNVIRGARLLLVDDVITTGASLEAAALVLAEHGVQYIAAAVFAQA